MASGGFKGFNEGVARFSPVQGGTASAAVTTPELVSDLVDSDTRESMALLMEELGGGLDSKIAVFGHVDRSDLEDALKEIRLPNDKTISAMGKASLRAALTKAQQLVSSPWRRLQVLHQPSRLRRSRVMRTSRRNV